MMRGIILSIRMKDHVSLDPKRSRCFVNTVLIMDLEMQSIVVIVSILLPSQHISRCSRRYDEIV